MCVTTECVVFVNEIVMRDSGKHLCHIGIVIERRKRFIYEILILPKFFGDMVTLDEIFGYIVISEKGVMGDITNVSWQYHDIRGKKWYIDIAFYFYLAVWG